MAEHTSAPEDTLHVVEQAPQSPRDYSGYASSTDDHFSDAPEDADREQSLAADDAPSTLDSLPSEAATGDAGSTNTDAQLESTHGQAPQQRSATSDDVAIPGAFNGVEVEMADGAAGQGEAGALDAAPIAREEIPRSDSPTAQKDTNGTTEEHSPEAADSLPTTVQGLQPDDSGGGEEPSSGGQEKDPEETSPDVVVRWNSEEDKIRRQVQQAKERIEKSVEEERVRSVSPSSSGSGPRRIRSMHSINGTLEDINTGAATNGNGVASQDFRTDLTSSYGANVSIDEATPSTAPELENATPTSPTASVKPASRRRRSSAASRGRPVGANGIAPLTPAAPSEFTQEHEKEEDDNDRFGDDDFDDFGETVDGDDFDDFEGFEEPDPNNSFVASIEAPPQLPVSVLDWNFSGGIEDELSLAMNKMFPCDEIKRKKPSSIEGRPFLTERSLSLWSQLVAPPPLQPPNWKISRIRRLFLVSLGVPVDLDEILPAETKQKKLVLPSLHQPRKSTDSRTSSRANSRTRSKKENGEASVTGPESLDIPNARILCSTSDMAMHNLTVGELKEHVERLESITNTASEVLTYWLRKRDSAMGDKETFETVIESLVGYARKKRQNR